MFESIMTLAILPEILLLVLIGFVLIFDLIWTEDQKRGLGWLSAGGLVLILGLTLAVARPGAEAQLVWGGMLRFDWLGTVFKLVFIFGAAVTSLFAMDIENLGKRGEFYILLLASTIGMSLMASSADLMMLYLSIWPVSSNTMINRPKQVLNIYFLGQ